MLAPTLQLIAPLPETLSLHHCQYLNSGLEHALFTLHSGEILVVKILPQGTPESTLPPGPLQGQLQRIYEQLLPHTHCHAHRWPRQTCRVLTHSPTHAPACEYLTQLANMNSHKKRAIIVDAQFERVYRTRDVFGGWAVCVEFKPKTVLPDLYAAGVLEAVAADLGVDVGVLRGVLGDSPGVEKLRWFKKDIAVKSGQGSKGNKGVEGSKGIEGTPKNSKDSTLSNQNPLLLYSSISCIRSPCSLPQLTRTKGHKQLPPDLTPALETQINHAIVHQLARTHLLSHILQIQSISDGIPFHYDTQHCYKKQLSEGQMQKLLEAVLAMYEGIAGRDIEEYLVELQGSTCVQQSIHEHRSNRPQKQSQHSHQQLKQPNQQQQDSTLVRLLTYLINITWRDVSIVFRANMKDGQLVDPQLWVIDDYLKEAAEMDYRCAKDELFLREYLRYKLGQGAAVA